MKYKVGDRVKIKSLDWYNGNKSKSHGTVACGGKYFDYNMKEWCSKIMTILTAYQTCYIMEEDGAKNLWTDEMIKGLVEDETLIERVDDTGLPFNEWLSHKGAFHIPDGYELKDENGNVINATKIVLEKKKKEYPKTYEECRDILKEQADVTYGYKKDVLHLFQKLLICRDAYWKIAGEEMGLGKPWKPDYNEESYEQGCPIKYVIYYTGTHITKEQKCTPSYILSFPTAKMRDAFKENFDPDIEICEELL